MGLGVRSTWAKEWCMHVPIIHTGLGCETGIGARPTSRESGHSKREMSHVMTAYELMRQR